MRPFNVFERDRIAPRIIARPADAFHITTRAWVIRKALLFNQGEPYDSARVLERERALRNLNLFLTVHIDTARIDGRLAAIVLTDDGWTTSPRRPGMASRTAPPAGRAGVIESNFLGTATSVGAVYGHTPDRNDIAFRFSRPSLFLRHAIASAEYVDRSDGTLADWIFGVPFFESAAKGAFTTDGEEADQRVLVFRDGDEVATPQRHALRFTATSGLTTYASSHGYTRLLLAATWRREDFSYDPNAPSTYSAFGTIGLGLQTASTHLLKVDHLNSFARDEDVDLSSRFDLGLWAAPRAFGYSGTQSGVGVATGGQQGISWRQGFGLAEVAADGVIGGAGLDSGRVSGAVTAVQFGLPRQTLVFHSEAAALQNQKPGDEFDLWISQNGPRLFGAHQFTGNRMVWAALEDRVVVTDRLWGLIGVGVAPFFDYGGAWYSGESPRLGADAGLSLRLGTTHSGSENLGEYAIGYRFGNGAVGHGWSFTLRRAIIYLSPGPPRTSGAPSTYGPRP